MERVQRNLVRGFLVAGVVLAIVSAGIRGSAHTAACEGPAEPSALSPVVAGRVAGASSRPWSGAVTLALPLVVNHYSLPVTVSGVHMSAITPERGLVEASGAGARWVRFMAFHWNEIEPVRTSPPTYQWAAVDEQSLLNAQAHRMETIAIIHYTPPWAQARPGYSCGPIRQQALDEFAQFLQALVARYGEAPFNVRYWELWNEPDVDPDLWIQIASLAVGDRRATNTMVVNTLARCSA